jgi:hypothetical protein
LGPIPCSFLVAKHGYKHPHAEEDKEEEDDDLF